MDRNATFDCSSQVSSNIYVILLIILASCVLLSVSLLIVVVICCTRALQTNTNILMASLAVSNMILASAAACLVDQSLSYKHANIPKGKMFGSFAVGAGCSATYLTVTHMCVIAVDRYIRIAHPFYYMKSVTKRHVFTILLCQWITGMIFLALPMLVYTDNKYHQQCIILNPPREYFSVYVFCYFSCAAVVCMSYMKIALLAFRHKKTANSRRTLTDGAQIVFKRNRLAVLRSVKFFALMFGVFLLFTIPPVMTTILNYFYPVQLSVHFSLMSFFVINSLLNSFIYIHMNKEFVLALQIIVSNIKRGRCQLRH